MSNTLPWRTLAMASMPSDFNAPSIAFPCGSRMPAFSVTVTRAFIAADAPKRRRGQMPPPKRDTRASASLHQHRPAALRRFAFGHDAEAFGDFGIGFDQAAEIAAEAVLVELLVGLHIP